MSQNEWDRFSKSPQSHVGIYGWRKRCLYLIVLFLLVVVIIDLTLTLWIIQVLGFNSIGMGDLTLVQQGVQLPDLVYVLGSLITSTIYSYKPMTIDSYDNITINTKNNRGETTGQLYLEENLFELNVAKFEISDKWNNTVFIVNSEEVVVGTESLPLNGEGGSKFEGKLQTSVVEAEKNSLRLESPGGELEVFSTAGVTIKSRAGDINLTTAFNIELNSGTLKIESSRVLLPSLKDITGNSSTFTGIFQLCACDNGKLFLGRATEHCARSEQSVMC